MAIRASHARARAWLTQHKTQLSLFSTFNLVMIVWQSLSAARAILLRQSGADLALVAVAAIAQHLIYLAFNWAVATRVLRPPPAEAVAMVIMGAWVRGMAASV
jgi:solute carrier family 10 (sodium/bile acid cotransporter), member 7